MWKQIMVLVIGIGTFSAAGYFYHSMHTAQEIPLQRVFEMDDLHREKGRILVDSSVQEEWGSAPKVNRFSVRVEFVDQASDSADFFVDSQGVDCAYTTRVAMEGADRYRSQVSSQRGQISKADMDRMVCVARFLFELLDKEGDVVVRETTDPYRLRFGRTNNVRGTLRNLFSAEQAKSVQRVVPSMIIEQVSTRPPDL
ncbi:MAG: hypothetical protein GF333_04265 [Candidatus Omnitrophica bacterium]|nr:hypothetical protein [Candidatus Omnitrophota bacterium]